jgi:hypothetical protein
VHVSFTLFPSHGPKPICSTSVGHGPRSPTGGNKKAAASTLAPRLGAGAADAAELEEVLADREVAEAPVDDARDKVDSPDEPEPLAVACPPRAPRGP